MIATNNMRELPVDPLPKIDGFEALLEYWAEGMDGPTLPAKDRFDFYSLRQWLGRISISEWEGDDLRFRLFGTAFADLFGTDLTNKFLCASLEPERADATLQHFRRLRDGPMIGHTTSVVPGREHVRFNVLDLPLSGKDGSPQYFLHGLIL